MVYKIWVGKRESDILTYKFFDYSITFYGSNNDNNISFTTNERIKASYSSDFSKFVVKSLKRLIKKDVKAEVHFYNNIFAFKIIEMCPQLKDYIVNTNSLLLLNNIRHKTLSRLWLCNTVKTPSFCLLSKSECCVKNLERKFGKYNSFIIQKNYSGGGSGTHLINNINELDIINRLNNDDLYLASPYYYPSQSLSCHILIDENTCVVFPVSEQILYTKNDKLEYVGNKYIPNNSQESKSVKYYASKIGELLRIAGYRGICGFDFINNNKQIMLIEINPRYQGSSYIINYSLNKSGLPSLFELNNICFQSSMPSNLIKRIETLNIRYSNQYIEYNNRNDIVSANKIINEPNNIVFLDGFDKASKFEKGCYLLRYIFPCDEL